MLGPSLVCTQLFNFLFFPHGFIHLLLLISILMYFMHILFWGGCPARHVGSSTYPLVPQPRTEPVPPALEAWRLNYCSRRKVHCILKFTYIWKVWCCFVCICVFKFMRMVLCSELFLAYCPVPCMKRLPMVLKVISLILL